MRFKNRWDNDSPNFFRFESIVKFDEVKSFYNEIYNLKLNFQKEFDSEFQKDKITQLKETLVWLSSFEADLNKYFKLKRNMPFFLDFGNGPTNKKDEVESIKKDMKVIEEKWRVNQYTDDIIR